MNAAFIAIMKYVATELLVEKENAACNRMKIELRGVLKSDRSVRALDHASQKTLGLESVRGYVSHSPFPRSAFQQVCARAQVQDQAAQ